MSQVSAADVKKFIVSYLAETLKSSGRALSREPSDDFDLLGEGVVDSLGIFNLTIELEQHFGREIDFEGLDPEKMTIIGPLCQYIEEVLRR